MVDEVTLLGLESPDRVITYAAAAAKLGISEPEVEIRLVTAISDGRLNGAVDAESRTVVLNGTPPNAVSANLIEQAASDLAHFDALLDEPKRQKKRSRCDAR